jgi:phage terminase Nu1 subunit (DNA packaging protein)
MAARPARSSRHKPHQFASAESILGSAPLFEGEDQKAHEELLKNVRAAITPPNFLVELSVRDIVYHTWSITRYQRYEVDLAKKLKEAEKIYRVDRLTELSIMMTRLAQVQQMIALSEQRRLRAFKQIEYVCTKFAKALRKAIADAQLSESTPSRSEPGAKSTA